jgi:hypothetical protein
MITIVLINVARLEEMFFTPTFANTAVKPAKKADKTANIFQLILNLLLSLPHLYKTKTETPSIQTKNSFSYQQKIHTKNRSEHFEAVGLKAHPPFFPNLRSLPLRV